MKVLFVSDSNDSIVPLLNSLREGGHDVTLVTHSECNKESVRVGMKNYGAVVVDTIPEQNHQESRDNMAKTIGTLNQQFLPEKPVILLGDGQSLQRRYGEVMYPRPNRTLNFSGSVDWDGISKQEAEPFISGPVSPMSTLVTHTQAPPPRFL